MKYDFFGDAGHGWLKVSKAELRRLGIANRISGCSYQKGEFAFLEEDCDLETFFTAKSRVEEEVEFIEHITNDSPIRGYERYRCPNNAVRSAGLL